MAGFFTKISGAVRSLGLLHGDIQKISRQIESAATDYKTEHAKEKPAPVVNAVLTRPEAEVHEDNARAGRHEGRDVTRLQVEVVGLVIGAILAGGTIMQLIVTVRTVGIAAKAAAASERNAAASEEQVRATQESIAATVNAFHLDQRAWLTITFQPGTLYSGKPITNQIELSNTGKTPATELHGFYVFKSIESADNLLFDAKEGRINISFHSLFPAQKNVFPSALLWKNPSTGQIGERILLPPTLDRIKDGQIIFVTYGRFDYADVFGDAHWITFCEYSSPPVRIGEADAPLLGTVGKNQTKCAEHNQIDKPKPQNP